MTNLLTDQQIRAIQAQHPTDNDPRPFARAIIAATVAKLTAGVSVEPVAWFNPVDSYSLVTTRQKETNEFQYSDEFLAAHTDPLYTADAIAAAHQAGRKSVHDKCVDVWKDEFLAAARVAALEEAAIAADLFCNGGESQRPLKYPVADAIRALIEKEST